VLGFGRSDEFLDANRCGICGSIGLKKLRKTDETEDAMVGKILGLLSVGALLSTGCTVEVHHHHEPPPPVVTVGPPPVVVEGDVAQPAPIVEVVPARPWVGAVWVPGHWDRRPHRWVWIGGHWR
jgi:hypothetical protein